MGIVVNQGDWLDGRSMKKRRQRDSAMDVAGAIQKMQEQHDTPEPRRESPAAKPDGGAAAPTVARAWKWARRVVLGYDRRP